MKRFILCSLLLLAPMLASAESPPFIGCGATGCIGVWGSIYVTASGDVHITKPDGANTSPLQCTLSEGLYFTLKRAHPGFKEIYGLLLTAQATQKNVFLRALESSVDCELVYAVVYP